MFDRLKTWMMGLGLRQARRVVVFVVGMTLLLVGIIMLVTPGPAFIVIPASLALLGLEFEWARRWLRKARSFIERNPANAAAANTTSANPAASQPLATPARDSRSEPGSPRFP